MNPLRVNVKSQQSNSIYSQWNIEFSLYLPECGPTQECSYAAVYGSLVTWRFAIPEGKSRGGWLRNPLKLCKPLVWCLQAAEAVIPRLPEVLDVNPTAASNTSTAEPAPGLDNTTLQEGPFVSLHKVGSKKIKKKKISDTDVWGSLWGTETVKVTLEHWVLFNR